MKLGLFTDPHYCNKEVTMNDRRASLSYEKVREAMTTFRAAGVEMVICLGDLVDACDTAEENREMIEKLTALIRSFGLPFYCLMGNHDYQNFTKAEFNELTGDAVPPFSASYGKLTLVFLDANYDDDEKVYEPGKVVWYRTRLPQDQMTALAETLAGAKGQHVYVFSHQLLDDTAAAGHHLSNSAEVRAMLEDAGNVKAVYAGHYHPGHEGEFGGIPYHTLPAMCEGTENRYFVVDVE